MQTHLNYYFLQGAIGKHSQKSKQFLPIMIVKFSLPLLTLKLKFFFKSSIVNKKISLKNQWW